jgi:ADP-ribose pyrophosphatase YjhB (NUDIX family)
MANAVRAIIMDDKRLLLMYREKFGSKYFTLVGGMLHGNENAEDGLKREIKEETGLEITSARFVYYEDHPEPYNKQYIYLCEVAPGPDAAIQEYSEEAELNKLGANIHTPVWVNKSGFKNMPFRSPQLQLAITEALKKGFPAEPLYL